MPSSGSRSCNSGRGNPALTRLLDQSRLKRSILPVSPNRLIQPLLLAGLTTAGLAACGASLDALPRAARARSDSVVVPMRSGIVVLSPTATAEYLRALRAAAATGLHGLALFQRHPTPFERDSLAARGLTVLSPLQGRVYRIRSSSASNPADTTLRPPVVALALLRPEHRVEPDLLRAFGGDSSLGLTVVLQAGVADSQARHLFAEAGGEARIQSDGYWRVTTTRNGLRLLSQADIVRWIGAAAGRPVPDNDITRMAIGVDILQAFSVATGVPTGLGGKGIQVGVFDLGLDESHDDFKIFTQGFATTNRVTVTNPAVSYHGTLVAGIIAASGRRSNQTNSDGASNGGSPFQWRGMAPQAELLEGLATAFDGAKLRDFILQHKMDLSNHSYGFADELSGTYRSSSAERDAMIRGDATIGGSSIPARLQVYSAGNTGGWSAPGVARDLEGDAYFSLNKGVKNGIVVGNWRAIGTENRVVGSSSLGPTYDGRIKPDLVAPGAGVKSTAYWDGPPSGSGMLCTDPALLVTTAVRRQFYTDNCGTSFSAAAVSGVLALILQQYATTYPSDIDVRPPLPSTLRGVLIHSAQDIATPAPWFTNGDGDVHALPGPDFVTGFGLINATGANSLIANRLTHERTIVGTCGVYTYQFDVAPFFNIIGQPLAMVRVTLAWDDVAGDPSLPDDSPRLVNDLDLVVFDPSGTPHYPWLLNQTIKAASDGSVLSPDQQICGTAIAVERLHDPAGAFVPAAATKGPDHLNNVELVEVRKVSGRWKVQVSGFSVPFGPQTFSLIGLPAPVISPKEIIFDASSICLYLPAVCTSVLQTLCQRHPEICRLNRTIPMGPSGPRLRFMDPEDRIILPVQEVFAHLGVPEPGGAGADSAAYELALGPAPLSVAIYSSEGVRIAETGVLLRRTRLTLRPDRRTRYFLVLAPAPRTALNRTYDLPLTVRPLTR